MNQRHPTDLADESGNVLPHEEEETGHRNRDTDIPNEQVRVYVNRGEFVEVHPLRMGICSRPFNFIIGRQTRTK